MSLLHGRCDQIIEDLQRRVHDLESDLASQTKEHHEETEKLIDKILAMANPAAVREFRRIPLESMDTVLRTRDMAPAGMRPVPPAPMRSTFPATDMPRDDRPPYVPRAPIRPHKEIRDPEAYRKKLAEDANPAPTTNPVPSTGSDE